MSASRIWPACSAAVAAVLAASAAAALEPGSCFHRTYSEAHLASQPAQSVRMLELRVEDAMPGTPDRTAIVRAMFTDAPEVYEAFLFCPASAQDTRRPERLACYVECDGGGFEAELRGADTLMLRTRGFVVEGSCGDSEGDGADMLETRWVSDAGAETTTFRLDRADPAGCMPVPAPAGH